MIVINNETNLTDVINQIGTNWLELARELGIDEEQIKKIEYENLRSINTQCARMFLYQINSGKNFTKLRLIEALFAAELGSVADSYLCKVCNNEKAE